MMTSILLSFIKTIAIIQIIMIIILLSVAYGLKYHQYLAQKQADKTTKKIKAFLLKKNHDEKNFIPPTWIFDHQLLLLTIINEWDKEPPNASWPTIRQNLIHAVILPNARKQALSRSWNTRYLACQSFHLAFDANDEVLLQQLMTDPIIIVSIHAALIAMTSNNQTLINTFIDIFSKGRHIQQSLFADFSSTTNPHLTTLIHHSLQHEKNPYVKAFCYRLLSHNIHQNKPIPMSFVDVESHHLELKMAALNYVFEQDKKLVLPVLMRNVHSPHWQMRAKSAQLLGKIAHSSTAMALEKMLHDEVWWVRIRAAEALLNLGELGISLLTQQTKEHDRYAYDAAMSVLSNPIRIHHD